MARPLRGGVALLGAAPFLGLFALFMAASPPLPDDWDGIGFLLSEDRFDMASFTPHPPGYPVYVALLRLAHAFTHDRMAAAHVIASLSVASAITLLTLTLRRRHGDRTAILAGALAAATPLIFRAATSVGSEAPALLALAVALASQESAVVRGLAVGVGLGIRLSWAPMLLATPLLTAPEDRLRVLRGAIAGALLWAVPFVLYVGPSTLIALFTEHARGHFETWGGTTVTHPGPMRVAWWLRDVFVDGLGMENDVEGAVISVALIALAVPRKGWRTRLSVHARTALLALPYGLWVLGGQNVREQPRHLLPLVALGVVWLATRVGHSPARRAAGMVLLVAMGLRTASDARARLAHPPAAAELLRFVSADLRLAHLPIFAGASGRFAALMPAQMNVETVASLGAASLRLGRMRTGPPSALVASDIRGLEPPPRSMTPLATFCRPPRQDRRAPCITLYEWPSPFTE